MTSEEEAHPYAALRLLIEEGLSAEKATDTLLDSDLPGLPPHWRVFFRPFVLSNARKLESRHFNRTFSRTMNAAERRYRGIPADSVRSRALHPVEASPVTLSEMRYKLHNGDTVTWKEMTRKFLRLKIAQMKKQLGQTFIHVRRLEMALALLVEAGKDNLGELPGWEEEVAKRMAGEESPAWLEPPAEEA